LPFFNVGRSGSAADALSLPPVELSLPESFLWSVGRSGSLGGLELVLVELASPVLSPESLLWSVGWSGAEAVLEVVPVELVSPVLSLGAFLCSVGRSGSLA
jgi:hypothetical protein